jgi:hypothetical protein
MTDQQDRREESAQTEDTRYERKLDDEAEQRRAAAKRLKRDPLAEPDENSSA